MDQASIDRIWEKEYARRAEQRARKAAARASGVNSPPQQPKKQVGRAGASKEMVIRAARFSRAMLQWISAGRPTRNDDEVKRIAEICQACEMYKDGKCTACGCNVSLDEGYFNKIRLATENCPLKKW